MTNHSLRLESEQLILRDFQQDDWEPACEWLCDAEVMRFFGEPFTRDGAKQFVESVANDAMQEDRTRFQLALALREEDSLVGNFSIFIAQDQWHSRLGGLGYRLSRKVWGKGYGTEGVGLLLRLGFEILNLHKIAAGASDGNPASLRVLEKNGMRREGSLVEHQCVNGTWYDEIAFGILAREWKERMKEHPTRN
jgi:RimJ/RimL family protein N-acetyltransferase